MVSPCRFRVLPWVLVFAAGSAPAVAGEAAAPPRILDLDFAKVGAEKTSDYRTRKFGYFRGVLPEGFEQNYAHWTAGHVETALRDDGEGAYLRFDAKEVGSRDLQFATASRNELAFETGKYYRLRARVRNGGAAQALLYFRQWPAPYRTVLTFGIPPTGTWETVTETFEWKSQTRKIGLFLGITDLGPLDFKQVVVEEIAREDMQQVSVLRPEASRKNYFRNTRLPLGLPSGWCYWKRHQDGTIEPDPAVTGPSGSAALRLASRGDGEIGLCSEPFAVADPNARNAVSFSYRADGKFTALVMAANNIPRATLELPPSADWRRVTVPFQAPDNAVGITLRVKGSGVLHLDAFRAAPEGETDYATDFPCEVALAFPPSETSDARIQFADEAPRVRYHVSGPAEGVRVRFSVHNLYGQSRDLPPSAPDKREGVVDYGVFPETPYGQFRIEARAYRGDVPVSPVNEIVATRLVRPVMWGKDAPESPFGVHVQSFEPSLRAVKAAGVNWARLHDAGADHTGWFWLEPEKGQWRFDDAALRRYRDNGLMIYGQLGTAPAWASYFSRAKTGRLKAPWYHDRYFQPLHQEDFANYVSTVVARYRGIVDDWFIWNEPFNGAWWAVDYRHGKGYITSERPAADFARLSRTAYEAGKKANPKARISGFGTSGNGDHWTRGVYDAGGYAFCDELDFHFYTNSTTGYPGDRCDHALDNAFGAVWEKEGKLAKPVIMSEGQGASLPSSGDGTRYAGLYKHTIPWENREDYHLIADRTVRFPLSFIGLGVTRAFLYSAHCYEDFSSAPSFLTLFMADGYPHPMLAAHSALAVRLEGRKFAGLRELADGVWLYTFAGEGGSVAVVSGRPGPGGGEIRCEGVEARAADLYGNPLAFPLRYEGRLLYLDSNARAEALSGAVTLAGTK